MIRYSLIPAIFAVAVSMAHAQFDSPFGPEDNDKSTASLSAETSALVPGQAMTLALELKHPAGWHSYYLNSGGIENSPAIEWKLPAGFTAGPIQWPVPEVKDGFAGKSFVYSGSPVFLVEIVVPGSAKIGETVTLTAHATWQICAEGCMNEEKNFSLSLPVAATSTPDPAQAALFKAARSKLPVPMAAWTATAYPSGDDVAIRLSPLAGAKVPATAPAEFIPNEKFLQPISAGGKVAKDGADWVITLKRATKDMLEQDIPQGDSLSGILVGEKSGAEAGFAVTIPATPIGKQSDGAAAGKVTPGKADKVAKAPVSLGAFQFLLVLGGMLIGGLILNLMPCVFPVIGLKIMSFVSQAGHDRRKIMAHGLVFTVGVLVSFGVLSGILFAARAAGHDINWGYQLQDPWVVLVLMLLMFVLALNLFGLFEIGTSATSVGGSLQAKQGLAGSFFSGVLATVVATPCSGPYLGLWRA
jgi:thiol:disulfide interchange protein DsbD